MRQRVWNKRKDEQESSGQCGRVEREGKDKLQRHWYLTSNNELPRSARKKKPLRECAPEANEKGHLPRIISPRKSCSLGFLWAVVFEGQA